MKPIIRVTIAAVALAVGAGRAAQADAGTVYTTIPDLSQVNNLADAMPDTAICNSNTSCTLGSQYVYAQFTLTSAERITGFSYYSYFQASAADLVGVNWSIVGSVVSSGGSFAPGSQIALPVGEVANAKLSLTQSSNPWLVTVTLSEPVLDLPKGTYYIGFESVLSGSADYTNYATSYKDYPNTPLIPLTTYFGQGAPDLSIPPSYQAAFSIYGQPAISLSGQSAGSAPEPSTWAMTLIGFAGLGWAARRRFPRLQSVRPSQTLRLRA